MTKIYGIPGKETGIYVEVSHKNGEVHVEYHVGIYWVLLVYFLFKGYRFWM